MAGTSYTRQSTITDGNIITAALFNDEFNQILSAFAYASTGTTGHQHDGNAGQGGNIEIIGDQDFKNKIVISAANNRLEFYVEVGSSPVEQIRIQDGAIVPVTDSDVDLGTTSVRFKDAFLDSATITTTALVTGVLTTTATQVATGGITSGSNIVSDTDSTDSLGSTSVRWLKGWFDTLTAGTLTVGSGSITDSSGAISFGNENLTTTGTVSAATITGTGTTNIATGVVTGDLTLTGAAANAVWDASDNALKFAQDAKLTFGSSGQLEMYHDGNNSIIREEGPGALSLRGNEVSIKNYVGTKTFAFFTQDDAVDLYFDNSKKFETTNIGVDVTGTLNASVAIDTPVLEVSTLRAKDATAAGSIANSTGVVTLASSVLTTADINGGTIDGTVIGATSAAAITAEATGAALSIRSSATGYSPYISLGRTSDEGRITVAAAADQGVDTSVAGDICINANETLLLGRNGTPSINISGDGVVINEDSADQDFRVESNGIESALFVDGATGVVTTGAALTVTGAITANAGIVFPTDSVASGAAITSNTLDDYEEGTWTPVYSAATTAPTSSGSPTGIGGYYTKVGRLVTLTGRIRLSTLTNTPAGTLQLAGLPFVIAATAGTEQGGSLHFG